LSCPKSVIGHPEVSEKLDSGLRTAGMTYKETDFNYYRFFKEI